jgi:hypothetical protein
MAARPSLAFVATTLLAATTARSFTGDKGRFFFRQSRTGHTQYLQCLSTHQRLRDLLPGAPNDSIKSLTGNPHAAGSFRMIQVLDVGQPNGLHLVRRQLDFLKLAQGDSGRFKVIARRLVRNTAWAEGTWHKKTKLADMINGHMPIMAILKI